MFTFLADEIMLSRHSKIDIHAPIRLFDLNSCDIDARLFIADILPSFYQLEWDLYTVKQAQFDCLLRWLPERCEQITAFFNAYYADHLSFEAIRNLLTELSAEGYQYLQSIKPYRRRSIANFGLFQQEQKQEWTIIRRPAHTFIQRTGDHRMRPRKFPEMSASVVDHTTFKKLLIYLARLVQSIHPEVHSLQFTCHQIGLVALPGAHADNAPEGIHQDGADYIISALVIERRGVQGGTSIIYGPDKQTRYLTITLQPSQGIFQADQGSSLWHDVTPIVLDPDSSEGEGVRNILGFDIVIDR